MENHKIIKGDYVRHPFLMAEVWSKVVKVYPSGDVMVMMTDGHLITIRKRNISGRRSANDLNV